MGIKSGIEHSHGEAGSVLVGLCAGSSQRPGEKMRGTGSGQEVFTAPDITPKTLICTAISLQGGPGV